MLDGIQPRLVAVRELLSSVFPEQWIGREGPTACPVRSPDVNHLDVYGWGHLECTVYALCAYFLRGILPKWPNMGKAWLEFH